jgi:cysteine sulfinate desulfinase/cysteine desulfurase-like protein
MNLLSERVAIVSVMWANNESGTFFPVQEMAELAKSTSIVGLGKACEMAMEHIDDEKTKAWAMRDRLEQGILAAVHNYFN